MKRHSRQTVKLLFVTLEAGGVRLPDSFKGDRGWDLAVDLWAGLLADVSEDDLVAAVGAYLRSPDARFMPTPGQLLDLVPGRRTFDDADATWGQLLAHASRHGRANPPFPAPELRELDPATYKGDRRLWAFDADDLDRDASIHVALSAVGGWRSLCLLVEDQVTAARASFRSAYRAELERRRHRVVADTARQLRDTGAISHLLETGKLR